jgi:hypothetical protein
MTSKPPLEIWRAGDYVVSKAHPRKAWRVTRIEGPLVYVTEVEKTTRRGASERTFKRDAIRRLPA